MAAPAAILSILVEANSSRATSELNKLEGTLQKAGYQTTVVEKNSGRMNKTLDESHKAASRASGSFGGLAKGILAAGGAFAAYEVAKGAIQDTLDLTESTIKLTAATGLDAKTASSWIEVMKARGIQATAVSVGFITLEKNIRNAEGGSKTAMLAFKQLGVPMQDIKNQNLQQTILEIADAFQKSHDPTQRAAIAQSLFGRNAKVLIPILAQGRQGILDALGAAQRYGAFLPNNVKQLKAAHEAQLNLNYAMDGLKIAFTQAVLPALVSGAQHLLKFIQQMRDGKGAGGQFAQAVASAFRTVKGVVTTVVGVLGGLKSTLIILGTVWAAGKVLAFVGAIQDAIVEISALSSGSVLGALTLGLGFLIYKLVTISGINRDVVTTSRDVAGAWRDERKAADSLEGAHIALVAAKIAEERASIAQKQAQQAAKAAADQYTKNSPQYRAAALDLKEANNQLASAHLDVRRAVGAEDAADVHLKKTNNDVLGVEARRISTLQETVRELINTHASTQDVTRAQQSLKDAETSYINELRGNLKVDQARIDLLKGQYTAMKNNGAGADQLKAKQEQLSTAVKNAHDDQQALNIALGNMPKDVTSHVAVNSSFQSTPAGVIGKIVGSKINLFARGGSTGEKVSQMGYFAGEEGPAHPEYILATNPRYRDRNLGLWAQAGSALGVPGFAQGGITDAVRVMAPNMDKLDNKFVVDASKAFFTNSGVEKFVAGILAPPTPPGGGGPVSGPSGTSIFQGIPVAKWIVPVLQWAQANGGWTGHITAGFATSGHAPGSSHYSTQYPGGAIDVGWNTSIAEGTALYDALKGYPGPRPLLWGGIYISGYTDPRGITAPGGHDYGHFSGTGHKMGGIHNAARKMSIPAYATGGLHGAWRVNASSEESPGRRGYYNIYPGGVSSYSLSSGKGYSILSQSGYSSDAATAGHALGPGAVWPHPSWAILGRGGKTTKVSVQDIGAGDNSAPTIGIYPSTISYLGGTPGSDLANVNIERADGHPFYALRGTPIPYFGALSYLNKSGARSPSGTGSGSSTPTTKPKNPNPGYSITKGPPHQVGPVPRPRLHPHGFLHFGHRQHHVHRTSAKFNQQRVDKSLVDSSTIGRVQKFIAYEAKFNDLMDGYNRLNLDASDYLTQDASGNYVLKNFTNPQKMGQFNSALKRYLIPARTTLGFEEEAMREALPAIRAAIAKLTAIMAQLRKRVAKVKKEIREREREIKGQRKKVEHLRKGASIKEAKLGAHDPYRLPFYKREQLPSLIHYHEGIIHDDEKRVAKLRKTLGSDSTGKGTLLGFLHNVNADRTGWKATQDQLGEFLTRFSQTSLPTVSLGGGQSTSGYISDFISIPQHHKDVAEAIQTVHRDMAGLSSAVDSTGGGTTGQQQNWQAIAQSFQRQLEVSQAQFGAFSNFTGAYASGGVTPSTGWALVGERGPELAHLPGGTRIYPNSAGGSGPMTVQVVIQDGAVDPSKIRVIANQEAQVVIRNETRRGTRVLPGRGGS